MSGGSYNYLCFKAAGEFGPDDYNLRDMIERLQGLGYAPTAAERSQLVRDKLREVQEIAGELQDVWYAVEWRDSGDWCDDQMRDALAKYETEQAEKRKTA